MRRKKYLKYRGLSQVSTDPYYVNRESVKVFKRLCILQICFALIDRKKQLLKLLYSLYSKRFSSRRIYSKINSLFLPSVERVLYGISNKMLSLTKKTRLFKYLKRKNFQLFTMRSVVLSDLLFILTGKRKKPFSRRTLWDHVFYMKQELRQFYPSLTDSMFSVLTKSPTKMETGIEWLLFDVGYAQSVWQSRQFVSHGKVKCNSDVLSVCAHVGSIGNLYVIKSPSVVSKLQQVACLFHGLRTFGFVFGKIAFSIVRYLYKYLLLSIRVTSPVLECVCRSRIVVDNTAMNLLNLWKGYVCDMRRSAINVIRGRDRVLAGFSKKTYSLVDRSLMFSRGSVWNRYV